METAKKGNSRKGAKAKSNPKKGKSLVKLINISDSETDDDSEHELSYYLNDRVKLMKEVLKIIKPKKIKSMAPRWMRNLEMEEINSMLFEELLGISNKRLKCIFDGKKMEDDNSSSTDPDEEQQKPIDIISLDDISDDEFIINLDSDDDLTGKQKKTDKVKVKKECKRKKIKKEKGDKVIKKSKTSDKEKKDDEQNLMSVLELLELQARARAIKSQLALESQKKAELKENSEAKEEISDNEDAVVIESPKNIEIIITSSESENEESRDNSQSGENQVTGNNESKTTNEQPGDQEIEGSNNAFNSNENPQSDNILGDKTKTRSTSDENINKPGECSKSLINKDPQLMASTSKVTILADSLVQAGKINNETEKTKNKTFIEKQPSSESDPKSEHEKSADKSETKKADSELSTNEKNLQSKETSPKQIDSYPETSKAQVARMNNRIYRKKKVSEAESNSENDESEVRLCKSDNSKIDDLNTKKTDNEPGTTESSEKQSDQLKIKESNINSQNISNKIEESEGIIINVDQSEIECITSD